MSTYVPPQPMPSIYTPYDSSRHLQDFPGRQLDPRTGLAIGITPFCGHIPENLPVLCVNCCQPGHVVANCHLPRPDGYCHGCPLHNQAHSLDQCTIVGAFSFENLQYYLFDLRSGLPELKLNNGTSQDQSWSLRRQSTQKGPLLNRYTKDGLSSIYFATLPYPPLPASFEWTIFAQRFGVPTGPRPDPNSNRSRHTKSQLEQKQGMLLAEQRRASDQSVPGMLEAAPLGIQPEDSEVEDELLTSRSPHAMSSAMAVRQTSSKAEPSQAATSRQESRARSHSRSRSRSPQSRREASYRDRTPDSWKTAHATASREPPSSSLHDTDPLHERQRRKFKCLSIPRSSASRVPKLASSAVQCCCWVSGLWWT
jgi:hypothetical protein